jgi:DNA-binding MarR family transcriptional regulator
MMDMSNRLLNATQILQDVLGPKFSYTRTQILLLVKNEPNIDFLKLAHAAGVSKACLSRELAFLSDREDQDPPGLGLLHIFETPGETHRKVRLTDKGLNLINQIFTHT